MVFLSSLFAKSKLTESGNGYEFPELPYGGQTGQFPRLLLSTFIQAVNFLWLFAATEGQKLKLASECNVCLQHFTHHDKWDPVRFTVFGAHSWWVSSFCSLTTRTTLNIYLSGYNSTEMLNI